MTKKDVQKVINKALTDTAFRLRLFTDPDGALKEHKLNKEELTALKSMKPELLDGFSSLVRARAWGPSSFKELGGAFLSGCLIILLFYAAWNTYNLVSSEPLIYTVGNITQSIDTFDRSKALLVIFFPLFSAVVTFWLGVAIEGRRADTNQANAETERQERIITEHNIRDISTNAASALSIAEGILSSASVTTLRKDNIDDLINEALIKIREGQKSIKR